MLGIAALPAVVRNDIGYYVIPASLYVIPAKAGIYPYCLLPLRGGRIKVGVILRIKGGHSSKVCPPFNANQLIANRLKSLLLF